MNSHDGCHTPLKRACLPIPALSQILDCLIIIRISSSFVNRFLNALPRNIFFLRNRVHSAIILMYFACRLGSVLCAKIFCAGSSARRNCVCHYRADFRAYPSSAAEAWKRADSLRWTRHRLPLYNRIDRSSFRRGACQPNRPFQL